MSVTEEFLEDEAQSEIDEVELNSKFQLLSAIFPQKDFEYIKAKSLEFIGKDKEFESFISSTIANEDIPGSNSDSAMQWEPQKNSLINTTSLEKVQYSLEAFVKKFKDPIEYFYNCPKGPEYREQLVEYLKDRFRCITTERIQHVVEETNYNLMSSVKCLEDTPPDPVYFNDVSRTNEEIKKYYNGKDENFVYEVNFVEHQEEILEYMKIKQEEKEYALEKAKILGELLECECCYDGEVLAEDAVTCTEGHVFCNVCFQRSLDVIMGDAKVEFPCFQECNGKFPMAAVKQALSAKAYNKLGSRIQYREVRAAQIPGMEFCISCDYGVIPAEGDEIFDCAKCHTKICRKCNKEYHHPRKCHESEEEYRATQERIKLEEQQTYNVVRTCQKCNAEFVKESGCNKMTCTCGTLMCYICREVITGYEHFNNGRCSLH